MRIGSAVGCLVFLGVLVGACSGVDPTPSENVQSSAQAIITACNAQTIGFPCDPDGPGGSRTECQGICLINYVGSAQCLDLLYAGVPNMDGKVCGNSAGVGD